MKRLFILLFVFAFVSIASDARAQTVLPGCDDEFYDIQENFGRSMIVRDQAVAREVLKRNDSSLAMTCFDQLMITAAKAGHIFSDVEPPPPPAFDPMVATGLGTFYGTVYVPPQTVLLLRQIESVVDQAVDNLMADFNDSLAVTVSGANSSNFGAMTAGMTTIANVMGHNYNCSRMHAIWYNGMMGEGITSGAKYTHLNQLFTAGVPGDGPKMAQELANDAAILGASQGDSTDLDTPGSYNSFRTIPVFTPISTVADVIGAM